MKYLYMILCVFCSIQVSAQEKLVIRNSLPIIGDRLFTAEVFQKMEKEHQMINHIFDYHSKNDTLTSDHVKWIKANLPEVGTSKALLWMEENNSWGDISLTLQSPFDISIVGCSWYCGGGPYGHAVSSKLSDDYDGRKTFDENLQTAWVEGKEGDGIGESISYKFENNSPRVTQIYINNGYVKSDKIWLANNRVKELEVLVNNIPYAMLSLDDTWQKQMFQLPDSLGRFESKYLTEDNPNGELRKSWTLTFRIVSVYPGTKYQDTAISEIFFSGVDVH